MNPGPIDPFSDRKIIDSWQTNAAPWTRAVREAQIESRNLVTNRAIVEAVTSRNAKTVLDIGCGEGWLARELSALGIQVTGVDAIPALIQRAMELGGGDFRVASYEEIVDGKLDLKFDLCVANFSLIGESSVDNLIHHVPSLLHPGGSLIIQTPHPVVSSGNENYEDGWRKGSWQGFSEEFSDPAPWFFRTIETWTTLLSGSGFTDIEIREPLSPITGLPASIIFMGSAAGENVGHRSRGAVGGSSA